MKKLLEYGRNILINSREAMRTEANKHRKDVTYNVGDRVWLSSENIQTIRPCKTLKDKQLGPYRIIERVGVSYRLKLLKSIKQHNVFSPQVLRPYASDPLPGQHQESSRPITDKKDQIWKIDDILESRRHYGRQQYKVKWHNEDRDDEWYYADGGEFDGAQDVVNEFHRRSP